MPFCEFSRFDPPPIAYQHFSPVFETWLGQLIDDLNAFVEELENCLPVQFAGKQSDGGGSATITITETGVLASDLAFAHIESSTNLVTVQKVTPSADTVTVLLSGDPGASTVIAYQVLRI